MDEYFKTTVTGTDEIEVKRRVAELVEKGFEVVSEHEDSDTVEIYKSTNGIGRSKVAFDTREENVKYIVVMRRRNAL